MFFRKQRNQVIYDRIDALRGRSERLENDLLDLQRKYTQLLEHLGLAIMHVPAYTELRKKGDFADPPGPTDV